MEPLEQINIDNDDDSQMPVTVTGYKPIESVSISIEALGSGKIKYSVGISHSTRPPRDVMNDVLKTFHEIKNRMVILEME